VTLWVAIVVLPTNLSVSFLISLHLLAVLWMLMLIMCPFPICCTESRKARACHPIRKKMYINLLRPIAGIVLVYRNIPKA